MNEIKWRLFRWIMCDLLKTETNLDYVDNTSTITLFFYGDRKCVMTDNKLRIIHHSRDKND